MQISQSRDAINWQHAFSAFHPVHAGNLPGPWEGQKTNGWIESISARKTTVQVISWSYLRANCYPRWTAGSVLCFIIGTLLIDFFLSLLSEMQQQVGERELGREWAAVLGKLTLSRKDQGSVHCFPINHRAEVSSGKTLNPLQPLRPCSSAVL